MYFSRSSLLRGALMITRRSLEGALKCALRDFRREEAIPIIEKSESQYPLNTIPERWPFENASSEKAKYPRRIRGIGCFPGSFIE